MIVKDTTLPEVKILIPEIHNDERGYFLESFNSTEFQNKNIPINFLQDNEVKSKKNSIRGLHYQLKKPQGKLVRAVFGNILDVAVDIRKGSPNFGKYVIEELSEKNKKMLYVPEGFAHGYCVLSKESVVIYKCTNIWNPDDEQGILWNDITIGIKWGINKPILSTKDLVLPTLAEQQLLPTF